MRRGKWPVASKTLAYGYHLLALREGGRRRRSRQRVARSVEANCQEIMTCEDSRKFESKAGNSLQAVSVATTRRVGREEKQEGGRGGGERMSVVATLGRASTAGERGGLTIKRSLLLSIRDSLSRQSPVGVPTSGLPVSLISDLRPHFIPQRLVPRLGLATPRFTPCTIISWP